MNIYLATAFACKEDFRMMKSLLEAAGHTISHDWSVDDIGTRTGMEKEIYLMECCIGCLNGIADSDVFILLARPSMAGAFVELGVAIGCGKPVILLDAFKTGHQDPIFYHLPNSGLFQHVKNTDDLLKVLGAPKAKTPFEKLSMSDNGIGRN